MPIADEEIKIAYIFIFTHLCSASKGFMKALKTFIKPFEAPQIVKLKIKANFYFTTTFWNAWGGRVILIYDICI